MIAAFYGKNDFSAHEALDALRTELDSDGALGDNTVRVDGASAKPDELLVVCQTLPFMSARRLVVVHDLMRRFEPQQGARRSRRKTPAALGAWESFAAALSDLPQATALVFMEGDISDANPFLKALPPDARVQAFAPPKQGEVAMWIKRRAERHGVALDARAIAALAALVGNQLWTLDTEIQKLGVYAGGGAVTGDDVRALVSFAREPSVFAMVDATIEGRSGAALDLLQRLLAEGEPPQRLLTMVARQYRLLIQTKDLMAKRLRAPEIAGRLRMQGFVVQKLLQQAPAYSIDRLRAAYRMLLDADLSIKRGQFDEETALQLLLVELATLAQQRPARAS
ncbi:MAG: DNA polymerase III subunit delta [Dehalococcoidia bacterium]